ncbi:sigma-54-dependent transcriptional regulator [Zunongwangia endophytica]|uniref:Sigma-54-dependent transcriptional regulator n=1 Tax=Zunongwangia endophytica TaxID=1808945 RepID=A0ABV8H9C5_9FLAO|nr:sigma-54 dependent transcriptional regulator [Zunongwangia endophytica]MDN3593504.1 sigma-54 dependent transcriptional regulator [Zunongwangia endophytica]
MTFKKANILIVDDDFDMLELLQRQLQDQNFHAYKASSVMEAINILKYSQIDLLVTDLQMPQIDGRELLKYVSDHYPALPALVITGFPSIDGALETMRSGAMDYLIKPFTKEELKNAIAKALPKNLQKTPQHQAGQSISYAGIIGNSEPMQKLIDLIERVKDNKATVLIQGESGTGKELIARAIHYKGRFAAQPFITVNCGGIPEDLLEAELFGYTKGAFTGALENRQGFFQAADKGTIFLDEIGNAPMKVQTRLLRVLQEKQIQRIGEQEAKKIDIRIIAATNSDLFKMVQNDKFREDLYYRLNVVNISTPPLRSHKSDIPFLANNFLRKYGSEYGKRARLSEKALELLQNYDWPGNVRELENIIQRALILSDDEINIAQLPDHFKYSINTSDIAFNSLAEIEKEYILKVLAYTDQNKTQAAEILKIDRKTLRNKLK